jgi:GTP-binding protein
MYFISGELAKLPRDTNQFAAEYNPETELSVENDDSFTVGYDADNKEYFIEGPAVERMLGYTNLGSEKGFVFFQKFMEERGIIRQLKEKGLKEGDTVRVYGHVFEYYES